MKIKNLKTLTSFVLTAVVIASILYACRRSDTIRITSRKTNEVRTWLNQTGGAYKSGKMNIEGNMLHLDWSKARQYTWRGAEYVDIPYLTAGGKRKIKTPDSDPTTLTMVVRLRKNGRHTGTIRTALYGVAGNRVLQTYRYFNGRQATLWYSNMDLSRPVRTQRLYLTAAEYQILKDKRIQQLQLLPSSSAVTGSAGSLKMSGGSSPQEYDPYCVPEWKKVPVACSSCPDGVGDEVVICACYRWQYFDCPPPPPPQFPLPGGPGGENTDTDTQPLPDTDTNPCPESMYNGAIYYMDSLNSYNPNNPCDEIFPPAPQDEDEDIIGDEFDDNPNHNIIDSLQGYPCAQNLLTKIGNLNDSISKLITTVFGDNEDFNLTFVPRDTMGTLDGETLYNYGAQSYWECKIALNIDVLQNATQEYLLVTMYHEALHGYLGYQLGQLGDSVFKIQYPKIKTYDIVSPNGKKVKKYDLLDDHENMGAFINLLEQSIKSFNPKMPADRVTAMVRMGIVDPSAMTNDQKLLNGYERNVGEGNSVGTKCPTN
ncbi:MAG: hypothetical protein E6Q95_02570 [Chitinophagaceae bacterium]|nr:MAG: hypothetical protein E6Q95_02570 [Chitinophagaceae bacterium]